METDVESPASPDFSELDESTERHTPSSENHFLKLETLREAVSNVPIANVLDGQQQKTPRPGRSVSITPNSSSYFEADDKYEKDQEGYKHR
jgi:hypothetical protein